MRTATAKLRPTPAGVVSFVLVVVGLVLGATVDMAWLLLFAAGVFGPALLREAGVLGDHDEFQRAASRLAGHRAYLAGGLFLAAVTIVRSWGFANLDHDEFPASASLTVMLVAYLVSYLTSYWGPRRAAFRVLLTFGLFWLVFAGLSHGLSPELAVGAPFIALAFSGLRWPRLTGVVVVLLAVAACAVFNLERVFAGNHGALFVLVVLVLPLLLAGIALLAAPRADDDHD